MLQFSSYVRKYVRADKQLLVWRGGRARRHERQQWVVAAAGTAARGWRMKQSHSRAVRRDAVCCAAALFSAWPITKVMAFRVTASLPRDYTEYNKQRKNVPEFPLCSSWLDLEEDLEPRAFASFLSIHLVTLPPFTIIRAWLIIYNPTCTVHHWYSSLNWGLEKLISVLSSEQTLNYTNGCQILCWDFEDGTCREGLLWSVYVDHWNAQFEPSFEVWQGRPGRPPLKPLTGKLRTILVSPTIFPNPEFFVSENFTISPRRVNVWLLDTLVLWL